MPNPVTEPVSKGFKAAFAFVFVTVFLDMLSLGIMIPVLPKLVEHFVGSASNAGFWMAAFGATWGLMQFIFSPIQGGLSDAYGRRPVILGSNLGTGLDFFLMALAPNIWVLLLGRAISGATAASISTSYAYISDITEPQERAKYFGMMGAAFGMGFVIGPFVGGWFGDIDPRLPFVVAGCLSMINFIYGFFVLPESLPKDKRKPFSVKTSNPIDSMAFLAKNPQVLRLSIINLVAMFAHSVLPTVFVLYAGYRFGWSTKMVGICLALVGISSAIVQAGLTGFVVKAIGEKSAMILGLFFGIVGFAGYGLVPRGDMVFWVIPIMALWGFTTPGLQALMTSHIGPQDQGRLQGANMGLSSMANIFAPIVFGSIFALSAKPEFEHLVQGFDKALSGAPLLVASFILFIALLIGLGVKPAIKRVEAPLAE